MGFIYCIKASQMVKDLRKCCPHVNPQGLYK